MSLKCCIVPAYQSRLLQYFCFREFNLRSALLARSSFALLLPCAIAHPPVLLPHSPRALSTFALDSSPKVSVDNVVVVKYQVFNIQTYLIGPLIRDKPLQPTLVAQVFTAV